MPQYSTNNVIAYPQNPDAAVRTICLFPEELYQSLAVQFVGDDPSVIAKDPAVLVSVSRLREGLKWLVTHSWAWLEATKAHGDFLDGNLGKYFENLLSRYAESLGGAQEGVPREIL